MNPIEMIILRKTKTQKQKEIIYAVLIIGIILIISAWISEILFHYIQEFNTETIDPIIFWKFEPVEAFNSVILLSTGIILIILIVYLLNLKKTKKRQKK